MLLVSLQAHRAPLESLLQTATPPVTIPRSPWSTLMCKTLAANSASPGINGSFTTDVSKSRVALGVSTLPLTPLMTNRDSSAGFTGSRIEPAVGQVWGVLCTQLCAAKTLCHHVLTYQRILDGLFLNHVIISNTVSVS